MDPAPINISPIVFELLFGDSKSEIEKDKKKKREREREREEGDVNVR